MTAVACLRILLAEEDQFADGDAMAEIVGKFMEDFLASKWKWPRRFGQVAPFAFLLADPRVQHLDVAELQALTQGLKLKLFGDSGASEVDLVMPAGSRDEVSRIISAQVRELAGLAKFEPTETGAERPRHVTPRTAQNPAPANAPEKRGAAPVDPHLFAAADALADRASAAWLGVYYLPTETFVGGLATLRSNEGGGREIKPVAGDYELLCVRAAAEAIATGQKGVIYLPIDFSTIIKSSSRPNLKSALAHLPRGNKLRLAATIMNVPRAPSQISLEQIRDFLLPHVSFLDLQVSDPMFCISDLRAGLANSVTLMPPGADGRMRAAALRTFLGQHAAYKAKRSWQSVGDVASAAELEICQRMNASCLSGPMVSGLLSGPVMDVVHPPANLPYRWPEAFRQAILAGRRGA